MPDFEISPNVKTFCSATDIAGMQSALTLVPGINVQAYYSALSDLVSGTYAGSTSITTLSTIITGTWNADPIAVAYGGTGGTDVTTAQQGLECEVGVDVQAYSLNLANLVAGTIDNITVGATTASTGKFTTLENSSGKISAKTGMKNRIINGDMRIDQRNEGGATTLTNTFVVDRWEILESGSAVFSATRDTNAPTGFINSLKVTITTADATLDASDAMVVRQRIEGYYVADLLYGTANAKTITLSFWVRSSITGSFGGSLRNNSINRSYPFSYTINVADTWEYKTVTIAGDTTGSWLTNNSTGIILTFCLGAGTDFTGTANQWNADNDFAPTGSVNIMDTLNATWYATGVQFEIGTTATEFQDRGFARELALCQRYYEKSFEIGTAPAQNAGVTNARTIAQYQGTGVTEALHMPIMYNTQKRDDGTVTIYNPSAANAQFRNITTAGDASATTITGQNTIGFNATFTTNGSQGDHYQFHFACDAEL